MPNTALDELGDVWAVVVAKAWENAAFRARLLSAPAIVLNEHGAALPRNLHTKVVDARDAPLGSWEMQRFGDHTTLLLSLPPRPVPTA